MHRKLSDCFKQAHSKYGTAAAVTLTYLASTMLHGLNFQLAAVLLSLGFYTYVEHSLRRKLAAAFDASITATKPRDPHSAYKHKVWYSTTVRVTSQLVDYILLILIRMFH